MGALWKQSSGKFGADVILEVLQREARKQGQILKATHETRFACPWSHPRWAQWRGMRSAGTPLKHPDARHRVFQCCFGRTPGQLRQCFGPAFISHCSFFSISVATSKVFYALRFLVIFKKSWSISVLFLLLIPLLNPPNLYILLSYIAKYVLKGKSLVVKWKSLQFSSVTQSCPTLCDPMNWQHARPPCPSPAPGVYPNSCLLSRWCHLTIPWTMLSTEFSRPEYWSG